MHEHELIKEVKKFISKIEQDQQLRNGEMTKEDWQELDGKTLTISIVDSGPKTTQVWGQTEDGEEFLLAEWKS